VSQHGPLVVPSPWKPLDEHPHLRPLEPRGERGGVLFCERCGTLWAAGWDQYMASYLVDPIDPAWAVLFERPAPSLARVSPLLGNDRFGRWLLTTFFRQAEVDGSEAARAIVRALGARDLTYARARSLFWDFHAVLDNPRVRERPRPAVRLDDADPLVKLFDHDNLRRETTAEGMVELRGDMERLVRAMFGSAFAQGVDDFVAAPSRARKALLRLVGHEERRQRVIRRLAEVGGDELTRLGEAHPEARWALWYGGTPPTAEEIRVVVATLARLRGRSSIDPWQRYSADSLAHHYHDLLKNLRDGARIPRECRADVDAALRVPAAPPAIPGERPAPAPPTAPTAPPTRPKWAAAPADPPRTAASSPGAAPPAAPARAARATPVVPPWTLAESLGALALPVIGVVAVTAAGMLLGELAVPEGDWRSTAVIALILGAGVAGALRLCRARGFELAVAFGALVGVATLGTAHWIAYAWDGTSWPVAHYTARGENVDGADRAALRTRLIREVLRDPGASGGMWNMLRTRAAAGTEASYRSRGRRVTEHRGAVALWVGWIGQVAIVMGATVLGGVLGGALAEGARGKR
jgi:hypothetical protein